MFIINSISRNISLDEFNTFYRTCFPCFKVENDRLSGQTVAALHAVPPAASIDFEWSSKIHLTFSITNTQSRRSNFHQDVVIYLK